MLRDPALILWLDGQKNTVKAPNENLARELDPRLVTDDLTTAIRTALDDPRPGYATRAAQLLEPFSPAALDHTLANDVLPALLPGWRAR